MDWQFIRKGTEYWVRQEPGGYVVYCAPAWSGCAPQFWSEYTHDNLPAWISEPGYRPDMQGLPRRLLALRQRGQTA